MISNVVVYSLPNCSHCKDAKDFFRNNEIDFIEHDLKKKENREVRKNFREGGYKILPILFFNDKDGKYQVKEGFDENYFIKQVK